jgi:YidC/Oxa1 family membrane protein insertase
MSIWLAVVDVVRAVLFGTAHLLGGSLGGAIVAVSVLVRLALIPLILRVERRRLIMDRARLALEPEVATLRVRFANDPLRLATETRELYSRHGVELVPRGTLTSLLVQAPLGAALYTAISSGLGRGVRFLWIAELARPDALLAWLAATLGGAATLIATGNGSSQRLGAFVSAAITLFVVVRLSAGLSLYWVASNVVGVVQALLVRRMRRVTT